MQPCHRNAKFVSTSKTFEEKYIDLVILILWTFFNYFRFDDHRQNIVLPFHYIDMVETYKNQVILTACENLMTSLY